MESPGVRDDFYELANEEIQTCLREMRNHWSKCEASDIRKRKEWFLLLHDIRLLPLKFKIQEVRKQISEMWEKCYKSEAEKIRFTNYSTDAYSEEVLEEHRKELANLHAFYQEHKDLIEHIAKYEEMWKCIKNIKDQSQNPERLFKNRGAQLLKEEQDRKLIAKLPQVQAAVLKMIQHKETMGFKFLIRGVEFSELIATHMSTKKEGKVTPVRLVSGKLRSHSSMAKLVAAPHSNGQATTTKRKRLAEIQCVSLNLRNEPPKKAVRCLEMK